MKLTNSKKTTSAIVGTTMVAAIVGLAGPASAASDSLACDLVRRSGGTRRTRWTDVAAARSSLAVGPLEA